MARKTKLTPEVQKRITDAIGQGATYQLACHYAGISEDTFARWRERYADFADAVKAAEGMAAVKWLALIDQAARGTDDKAGQWQAAAWKLERRYPHDYGRQIVDNNNNNSGEVTLRVVYDTNGNGPSQDAGDTPTDPA